MNIVGMDISMNGSGIVRLVLNNDTLDIVRQDYLSFTSVKKNSNKNIIFYKKEMFKNNIEKADWMIEQMINFSTTFGVVDYCGIEGYAFSASGRITDIAEFTGLVKYKLYELGWKIRLYDPCSIKMYGTGIGNADKVKMTDCYMEKYNKDMDVSYLPLYKSPSSDIIDAYFIAKLLQIELKLRNGLVKLKDLSEVEIRIMNRVTKSSPVNLLDTPFLEK
jgi:Holliday junction resolvasome RuvABC endonuclease subunit